MMVRLILSAARVFPPADYAFRQTVAAPESILFIENLDAFGGSARPANSARRCGNPASMYPTFF